MNEEKKLTAEEIVKDIERSTGMPSYWKKIVLDLIHRLQDENETQRKIIEYQDGLPDLIEQKKAEIERLTEELATAKQELVNEKRYYENAYSKSCQLETQNVELQKQVDELKEQLKSVQSACQSKNGKIKTLNSEKYALQNELNFQNEKPHYRYVIWNTKQNKRQFLSICELTESGAYTKLFQKIGWDSAKYRFEVRRIKVDGIEVE